MVSLNPNPSTLPLTGSVSPKPSKESLAEGPALWNFSDHLQGWNT